MRKHNFGAGPSVLPDYTLKKVSEAVLDYNGCGMSIMEISHRGSEYTKINDESQSLMKELLDIPSGYSVLFLHGGANLQFTMVPYNLLNRKAAYLDTGTWAAKAIKEAKLLGDVEVVASSKEQVYNHIPKGYKIPIDVDYFHITLNNTIYGTEIHEDMDSPVPLVTDASSNILSRPMDVSKYALIYAGVQKNLGPAGVAVVIIRDSILGKVNRNLSSMLDYKIHMENASLYNTPPCIAVFACVQTMKWLKELGGVKVMQKMNVEKAKILYDEISRNKLFVSPVIDEKDRSFMNVTFIMNANYKDLEEKFIDLAKTKGIVGIKGHRSIGGFRASIYNAMPKASVQVLVDTMKEFEAKN